MKELEITLIIALTSGSAVVIALALIFRPKRRSQLEIMPYDPHSRMLMQKQYMREVQEGRNPWNECLKGIIGHY